MRRNHRSPRERLAFRRRLRRLWAEMDVSVHRSRITKQAERRSLEMELEERLAPRVHEMARRGRVTGGNRTLTLSS